MRTRRQTILITCQRNANQKANPQAVVPTFTATPAESLILVPTAILTPSPAPINTQGVAIVNADGLNLRTEPNTSALVITRLSAGDCLAVKQTTTDWSLLSLADGREGWSATEYLSPTTICPTQTPTVAVANVVNLPVQKKAVVNTSVLNVRAGPGIEFQSLTQIGMNDCVDVLGFRMTGYKCGKPLTYQAGAAKNWSH